MSVIFEGIEMQKACCWYDEESCAFAHWEHCQFYAICKQRETIHTNHRPLDCPLRPLDNTILDKVRDEVLEYIENLDTAYAICEVFDKYKDNKVIREVNMNDIITVRCYYKEEKFTRSDAYKKYREAYECSDGSEKERYMEVLMDLADGKDYCDDKVY